MVRLKDRQRRRCAIVIHPSDEMYGADKVLLEALRSTPPDVDIEVWLPTDVDYPKRELSKALIDRGISVRHLPLAILRRAYMRPTRLPGLLMRWLRTAFQLLKTRPDFVYLNTAAAAAYAPIARVAGARTVLHLHEYIDGRTRVVLPMVGMTHAVIAVSNAIVSPLPPRIRARTHVIYNGFDFGPPVPLPEGTDIRLLFASRWNAWKGHDVFLDAWNQVERSDLRLTILGSTPASGESIDVEALVVASPHAHRVTILGQSDDPRSHTDASHVIVVPSTLPDPLPTIAIEGIAAGRFVLASDIGGLPEIIGDDTGRLVRSRDVDAWIAALYDLDLEEIRTKAGRARSAFDARFSRDRFGREISALLWSASA